MIKRFFSIEQVFFCLLLLSITVSVLGKNSLFTFIPRRIRFLIRGDYNILNRTDFHRTFIRVIFFRWRGLRARDIRRGKEDQTEESLRELCQGKLYRFIYYGVDALFLLC